VTKKSRKIRSTPYNNTHVDSTVHGCQSGQIDVGNPIGSHCRAKLTSAAPSTVTAGVRSTSADTAWPDRCRMPRARPPLGHPLHLQSQGHTHRPRSWSACQHSRNLDPAPANVNSHLLRRVSAGWLHCWFGSALLDEVTDPATGLHQVSTVGPGHLGRSQPWSRRDEVFKGCGRRVSNCSSIKK
jgi:hypothetical protein